jgi:acetyl-CoA C-acetyltransferase
MLEEIHLAGSVRTPFGSFCGAFADVSAVELGKAPVERSGVKPQDVKELLEGNILSGAHRPNAAGLRS